MQNSILFYNENQSGDSQQKDFTIGNTPPPPGKQ